MQLIDVVMKVESGCNPNAVRFESFLYLHTPKWISDQIAVAQDTNKCSFETARMIVCTSWGAWQLLGANICSISNTQVMQYPLETQRADAMELMRRIGFDGTSIFTTVDLHTFVKRWNGPNNISAYIAKLHEASR